MADKCRICGSNTKQSGHLYRCQSKLCSGVHWDKGKVTYKHNGNCNDDKIRPGYYRAVANKNVANFNTAVLELPRSIAGRLGRGSRLSCWPPGMGIPAVVLAA